MTTVHTKTKVASKKAVLQLAFDGPYDRVVVDPSSVIEDFGI